MTHEIATASTRVPPPGTLRRAHPQGRAPRTATVSSTARPSALANSSMSYGLIISASWSSCAAPARMCSSCGNSRLPVPDSERSDRCGRSVRNRLT